MNYQINKKEILDFLHKNYKLEKDYDSNYGEAFNDLRNGFSELVRIYNVYEVEWIWPTRIEEIHRNMKEALRHYLSELGKRASEQENVLEFIRGEKIESAKPYHPHQWHLGVFYQDTADILTEDFVDLFRDIDSLTDFENLYNTLNNLKNEREKQREKLGESRKLGFGQVCVYDTALRMAYRYAEGDENNRLMPARLVYLHAKPIKSAKLLEQLGLIPSKVEHRMPTDMLQPLFHPYEMHPIDIENFMCVMNGPIRALSGLPLKEPKK